MAKPTRYKTDSFEFATNDGFSNEQKLFAAIIHRAANDFDYYMTLPPNKRGLNKYEDALDAYRFFHELGCYIQTKDTPLSFKSMLALIFRDSDVFEGVLAKFKNKYAERPPTPEDSKLLPDVVDRTRYQNIVYSRHGNPQRYKSEVYNNQRIA